jgi:hypothetical protein
MAQEWLCLEFEAVTVHNVHSPAREPRTFPRGHDVSITRFVRAGVLPRRRDAAPLRAWTDQQ